MKYDNETVAICMATYNGEKYIAEQLQSIVEQTYGNWRLFIHDDGSTDRTVEIIKTYPDDRIHLIEDGLRYGSAKDNFAGTLNYVKEKFAFQYFMFADQDDVWLCHKIEVSMKQMIKAERGKSHNGGETLLPVLIHTDLKVVDENLRVLGESFMKYRALNPHVRDLNHLLAQNNVTGCTMLWNRSLNDKINLGAKEVAMHDWWFSTSASLLGTIEYVEEPTILYRQHGNNTVGATKVNTLGFILKRLLGHNHVRHTIELSVEQAKGLLAFYGSYRDEDISVEDHTFHNKLKVLEQYGNLYANNKLVRMYIICKYHFLKQGFIQIVGQLMFV